MVRTAHDRSMKWIRRFVVERSLVNLASFIAGLVSQIFNSVLFSSSTTTLYTAVNITTNFSSTCTLQWCNTLKTKKALQGMTYNGDKKKLQRLKYILENKLKAAATGDFERCRILFNEVVLGRRRLWGSRLVHDRRGF